MQSLSSSNAKATNRKRVIINIERSHRKSKPNLELTSDLIYSSNKQVQKLIEISDRCVDHYEKFKEERLDEEHHVQEIFRDLVQLLENTFEDLYTNMREKQVFIRNSILHKKEELLSFYPEHFLSLTHKIQRIQNQKLMFVESQLNCQAGPNYFNTLKVPQTIKQQLIGEFATILNDFYSQVQTMKKQSSQKSISSTINYLRNMIENELTLFNKQHNQSVWESTSRDNIISLNRDFLSVQEFNEDTSIVWQEIKASIEKCQQKRENKIQNFYSKVEYF